MSRTGKRQTPQTLILRLALGDLGAGKGRWVMDWLRVYKVNTEKTGHPERKRSYSNHSFSGAFAVSFREGK